MYRKTKIICINNPNNPTGAVIPDETLERIAQIAKELGILTVGIVTKPFQFESRTRMANAEKGIQELKKYVDTIVVIFRKYLFHDNCSSKPFPQKAYLQLRRLYP